MSKALALFLLLIAAPCAAQQLQQPAQPMAVQNSVPIPDPTTITTKQIEDAKQQLEDKIDAADKAIREFFDVKIAAIEKATDLRISGIERIPAEIREQIKYLNDLIMARFSQQEEKFISIQRQFDDQARNVDKIAGLSKEAIDSAFASSEKAIGKSDENTSNLIAQQGELQRTQKDQNDTNFNDIKNRLTTIESRQIAQGEAKTGFLDNTSALVAVGGLALGLVVFLSRRPPERVVHVNGTPTTTTTTAT